MKEALDDAPHYPDYSANRHKLYKHRESWGEYEENGQVARGTFITQFKWKGSSVMRRPHFRY